MTLTGLLTFVIVMVVFFFIIYTGLKKKNPNIDKLIRGWIPHKKETEQNNNGGEIKKQIWTDQRTIL